MDNSTINVSMPKPGDQLRVDVKPGERVSLENIDLNAVLIDIVGPDLVMVDPTTNAKIFFPGLGLILFSESDAPQLVNGDTPISPQDILSRIGTIKNVEQGDLLSFTSLELNPEQGADEHDVALPDVETPSEESNEIQKAAEEFFDIASYMEQFQQSDISKNSAQLKKELQQEHETIEGDSIESIQSSRAEFLKDADGGFDKPPTPQQPAGTPQQKNEDFTQEQDKTEDHTGDDTTPPAPEVPPGEFLFLPEFLQVSREESLASNTLEGGGGNTLASFLPNPEYQYAPEEIDTTGVDEDHVIIADNQEFFSNTEASRVLKLDPVLPPGFDISEIVIKGLPVGFELGYYNSNSGTFSPLGRLGEGREHPESPDLDEPDYYILENPETTASGDVQLVIKYPVPAGISDFDLDIRMTAKWDEDSETIEPAESQKTQTYDMPTQNVEIRDITDPSQVSDGEMVLSNIANGNIITTSDANVEVYGGQGTDNITTGAGDDTVYGSLGDDNINAGLGINTLNFSLISTDLNANLTSGAISASDGSFAQSTQGFDHFTGGTGNDIIYGNSADNIIKGDGGNDTIYASLGDDDLDGGAGVNTLNLAAFSSSGEATVNLGEDGALSIWVEDEGHTHISTIANFQNVIGSNYDDVVYSSEEDNIFFGMGGHDTFIKSRGHHNNNTIDGGEGYDTVDYSTIQVHNGLFANLSNIGAQGYANIELDGSTDRVKNIEALIGTYEDDTIIGSDNDFTFYGKDGDDTITGGAGDDVVFGGAGSNTLDGGGGNNTLNFSDLTEAVSVRTETGPVTAGFADHGLDTDTFFGFSNFILTNYDDVYVSTAFEDNIVHGGAGNDLFTGSYSDDVFNGGSGIDTISYQNLFYNLTVDISDPEGSVTAHLGLTTLFQSDLYNIENIITGRGDDIVIGSAAHNVIITGFGDDTIIGSGGNDQIEGGTGENWLDYSDFGTYVDVYMSSTTHTIFKGSEFIDRAIDVQNIIGTAYSDSFKGNAENNHFNGYLGSDFFIGSLGNDRYDGGDALSKDSISYSSTSGISGIFVDLEVTSEGYSQVTFPDIGKVDYIANIENIYGSNSAEFGDVIKGNSADNTFGGYAGDDFLDGRGGNDTLFGGSGDDTLYGGDGNDRLSGGTGSDTLKGEAGDDLFSIGNDGGDVIDGGDGFDIVSYTIVFQSINVNLSIGMDSFGNIINNVEDVLGGAHSDLIVGDSGNNSLAGYYGDDVIRGMDGSDWIEGDYGNDILWGDQGDDTIDGGYGDDILYGGEGDDILYGGEGNDTIYGGEGNNTIFGNNGASSYYHETNTLDYSDATGHIEVSLWDNIAWRNGYGGIDEIYQINNVIGTDYNDTIIGDNSNNTFYGGAGHDVFEGSGGSNILDGGVGIDTANYSRYNNSITYEDGTVQKTSLLLYPYNNATTDTLTSIENINGSAYDDEFRLDTDELTDFNLIDGKEGNDLVTLDGILAYDGDTLDSIFNDIEELDLTGAELVGGDTFELSIDDIMGMTDGGNTLHMYVNSGFNLDLDKSGFILDGFSIGGTTQTLNYVNENDPTETVTLEIETIATV